MSIVQIRSTPSEFMQFLDAGILRLDPDGTFWRCKFRRAGSWGSKWMNVEPRRAEHDSGVALDVRIACGGYQYLQVSASRLVWHVFHGPLDDTQIVRHRDLDYRNNEPSNLYLAKLGVANGSRRGSSQRLPPRPRGRTAQIADPDYLELLRSLCNPDQQRILETVVETGTQAKAARKLGCSDQYIGWVMRRLAETAASRGGVP